MSRGRGGKRKRQGARRDVLLNIVGPADQCDCPACTGGEFDPDQVLDDLLGAASGSVDDPLDAELGAATLLSFGAVTSGGADEVFVDGLIPQFEERGGAEALAVLMAMGAVADGKVAETAQAAAGRLVKSGVARPRWADDLAAPMTVADCSRLYDPQGIGSMLVCVFRRAGRGHAILVGVDHTDCGAASEILLVDEADLPQALDAIRASGRERRLDIRSESLKPAELRWQIENALAARAVHDAGDGPGEEEMNAEGPNYPTLAVLVRARMAVLPAPGKPPAPHADGEPKSAVLQALAELAGVAPGGRNAVGSTATSRPPKRKKAAGPAPIYQIKVGLRGAKPPIWRRLEVPADVNLATLHAIIQAAFDWTDSHLHAFETPYGDFGIADPELGHRAERPVTLEQVAPAVNSRIRYVYDFGDDWDHDIQVEKIIDRDPTARYPRCIGGRRAAPPDDSGGMWGYLELIEVLNDPAHPEHRERLSWLGIDDAADFTPDRFDAEAVNRALSTIR